MVSPTAVPLRKENEHDRLYAAALRHLYLCGGLSRIARRPLLRYAGYDGCRRVRDRHLRHRARIKSDDSTSAQLYGLRLSSIDHTGRESRRVLRPTNRSTAPSTSTPQRPARSKGFTPWSPLLEPHRVLPTHPTMPSSRTRLTRPRAITAAPSSSTRDHTRVPPRRWSWTVRMSLVILPVSS